MRHSCVPGIALSVALFAIGVPCASAQPATPEVRPVVAAPVLVNADGTVSVKAAGVPLQVLLEALQRVCALDVRLEPAVAAHPISGELDNHPPAPAVGEVLQAAGLNFAMHTRCGPAAHPMMVVALDAHGVPIVPRGTPATTEERRPVAAVESPPPATELVREPEKRDDPNTIAGGTIGGATPAPRELAPGQLTDEQLLQALTPPAGPKPA